MRTRHNAMNSAGHGATTRSKYFERRKHSIAKGLANWGAAIATRSQQRRTIGSLGWMKTTSNNFADAQCDQRRCGLRRLRGPQTGQTFSNKFRTGRAMEFCCLALMRRVFISERRFRDQNTVLREQERMRVHRFAEGRCEDKRQHPQQQTQPLPHSHLFDAKSHKSVLSAHLAKSK